jgi:hypothetical protein
MTPDRPVSVIPSPRVCAHEPILREALQAAMRLLGRGPSAHQYGFQYCETHRRFRGVPCPECDRLALERGYELVTQEPQWVVLPCVAPQVVEKDATISGLSERVAGQLGEIRRLESLVSVNRKPLSAGNARSGDASDVRTEDRSHAPGWIKTGEAAGPDGVAQETGHVAGVTTHELGKRFGDFAEDRRAPIDDNSPLRRHARLIPTPEQLAASRGERPHCVSDARTAAPERDSEMPKCICGCSADEHAPEDATVFARNRCWRAGCNCPDYKEREYRPYTSPSPERPSTADEGLSISEEEV